PPAPDPMSVPSQAQSLRWDLMKKPLWVGGLLFLVIVVGMTLMIVRRQAFHWPVVDTAFSLVDSRQIVACDEAPYLMREVISPSIKAIEEAAGLEKRFGGPMRPLITSDDAVIGLIDHAGHARAYPLRLLSYHGVVNDEFDGRLIAVTYCPWSGGAAVFDRR